MEILEPLAQVIKSLVAEKWNVPNNVSCGNKDNDQTKSNYEQLTQHHKVERNMTSASPKKIIVLNQL